MTNANSSILTSLLVGAHFRPPAKQILQHLPTCTPLRLEPEPDNAYDSFAVQVWVDSASVPPSEHEALEAEMMGTGISLEEFLGQQWWHLGYVAASANKDVAKYPGLVGNREFLGVLGDCRAELGWMPDGRPSVRLIPQQEPEV